jgi:hypothetical protein
LRSPRDPDGDAVADDLGRGRRGQSGDVAPQVIRVGKVVQVRAARVRVDVKKCERLEPLGGEPIGNAADAGE